jgi:hypothetical protein
MPDETKPAAGFPDPQKNNDEVARKLAEQDQAGRSNTPDPLAMKDAGEALDALAQAAQKDHDAPEAKPDEVVTPAPDPAAQKAAEEAAAKATAEAAARAEESKKADELFKDAPQLPQNASTKSVEAFASIKIRASQEISKLSQELAKVQSRVKEFEDKSKTPAPELEAKEKELTELRQRLAKFEVDLDPKFQEFDKKANDAREIVYGLLKESPVVTDALIEQIKKYGGPDKTNLSKLFEAMKDPSLQKMVETKLLDIKTANMERERAVKSTKDNVQEWLKEKANAGEAEKKTRADAVRKDLNGFLGNLDWFKERQPTDKATDAEKKEIEEHNSTIKQYRTELEAAVGDESPRMKAILLTGLAQLTNLQKVHDKTVSELATAKKELADAQALVAKVKASSTNRLRESAAPTDGKLPEKRPDPFNTHAVDALDTLAKSVMEQRRAAGK